MTKQAAGTTVRGLIKVLIGLLLWTGVIVAAAFWISHVLGAVTALFLAFVWTFGIAPRLAGQMVAALVLYFRERKQGGAS